VSEYFNHHAVSNSDVKEMWRKHNGIPKHEGLQPIFDFGTEFHSGILEPHKSDLGKLKIEDQELIRDMSKTYWKDDLCRKIAMMPDFRREHVFVRANRLGFEWVRCKADGDTAKLRLCLELKGLAVSSQKAFEEAILFHDYDQATSWYLNVMPGIKQYDQQLIVGISKTYPDRMFKLLVDRRHENYKSGVEKLKERIPVVKSYGIK
jgi:hypothetical protein